MDQKDLKAIDKLIKKNLKSEIEPLKTKLDKNTASVMKIEQKIGSALELRQDVSEVRTTVKNHETRLTTVEETLAI